MHARGDRPRARACACKRMTARAHAPACLEQLSYFAGLPACRPARCMRCPLCFDSPVSGGHSAPLSSV
eukprot:15464184-Alexandrium_andersonii.AAC.1